MEEISFELVVFQVLKKQIEGLSQKELVVKVCKLVKIGHTKAREEILKLTYPIQSNKDQTDVYPSLIYNKDFNISTSRPFRLYKLNEYWLDKDENEFKKFLDTHVNINYELRISE